MTTVWTSGGEPIEVPESDALSGWERGEYRLSKDAKVPVTVNGVTQFYGPDDAAQAVRAGGSLATSAQAHETGLRQAAKESTLGQVATASMGFAGGLSMGAIPAAVYSAGMTPEQRKAFAVTREENAFTNTASEVAGAVVASAALPAGGIGGMATEGIGGGLAAAGISKAAPIAAGALKHAVGAGLESGMYAAGMNAADMILHDKEVTSEAMLTSFGGGFGFGVGLGGVLGGIGGKLSSVPKTAGSGKASEILAAQEGLLRAGKTQDILDPSLLKSATNELKGILGKKDPTIPTVKEAMHSLSLRRLAATVGGGADELRSMVKTPDGLAAVERIHKVINEELPLSGVKPTRSALENFSSKRIASNSIQMEMQARRLDDFLGYDTRVALSEVSDAARTTAQSMVNSGETRATRLFNKRIKDTEDFLSRRTPTEAEQALAGRVPNPGVRDLVVLKAKAMDDVVRSGVPEDVVDSLWTRIPEDVSPLLTNLKTEQQVAIRWYKQINDHLEDALGRAGNSPRAVFEDAAAQSPVMNSIKQLREMFIEHRAMSWLQRFSKRGATEELRATTALNINAGFGFALMKATAQGAIAGSVFGPMAGLATSAGSLALSQFAKNAQRSGSVDRFAGNLFHMASKGVKGGLGAEEAMAQAMRRTGFAVTARAADVTSNATSKISRGVAEYVRMVATPSQVSKQAARAVMKSGKAEREEARQTIASVKFLRDNPKTAKAMGAEVAFPMAFASPEIARLMQAKHEMAVKFLESKLPEQPTKPLFGGSGDADRFSASELDTWQRYAKAVNDPTIILRELKTNTLSRETVEAVRATSPALYGKIVNEIVAELSALEEPIEYQHAVQLNLLFGVETDPTLDPGFVKFSQTMLGAKEKDSSSKGGGRGGGKFTHDNREFFMTYAKGMETPMAKVTGPK